MSKLEEIAGFAVKKTGIFHNQPSYYKNKMKKPSKIAEGLDKQVNIYTCYGSNLVKLTIVWDDDNSTSLLVKFKPGFFYI
jgi:hypothetical protein